MFCKNCGKEVSDNAVFCYACGSKLPGSSSGSRSDADMKNLPDYAKENGRNRPDDSGGNRGDGIVRLGVGSSRPAKPEEPTGFVNPLKDSGKTIFRNDGPTQAAGQPPKNDGPTQAAGQPPKNDGPAPDADQTQKKPEGSDIPPVQENAADAGVAGNAEGNGSTTSGEPTGFVNPLKDSGQEIHWGSDGDRNLNSGGGFYGDSSEIESNLGLAIAVTAIGAICGCNGGCITIAIGIAAIIFASQVEQKLKAGDYIGAKKSSDTAKLLCWIAIVLFALNILLGFVVSAIQVIMAFTSSP